MGLGKTIMLIALIHARLDEQRKNKQGGTLIVVPLSLLNQWEKELI